MAASIGWGETESLWAQGRVVGSGVRNAATARPAAEASRQAAATLSPIQELHRRAYYQAIEAGYHPAQAKAHADSVVQNAASPPQRAAYAQQAPQALNPQQHPSPQHWEQQRVAAQHQMAAAQQNARLWESIQRQRGAIAQSPPANRNGRNQAAMNQAAMNQAAMNQRQVAAAAAPQMMSSVDEAEARGVRAASAQLAKMHARSERIESAVAGSVTPGPVTAPAQLVGTPRTGPPSTPPRSVVEPSDELTLPGPQLPPTMAEHASPPPRAAATPLPAPGSEPTPVTPTTPRAPRKLPQVDPQPLQREKSELEVELEGFTDELIQNDGSEEPSAMMNQPVSYQQPIPTPSYARQDYVPSLGQPAAAPSPLVDLPAPPNTNPSVSGFAVEPVPSGTTLSMPARSSSAMNSQWDEQNPEFDVPPPTGVRVNPVSSGGRRIGMGRGYSQDDAPSGTAQDGLEEVPLPRSLDRADSTLDEVEYGSGMKSCDELRKELLGIRLSDISLDLAPPASTLPPSEASTEIREWRDAQNRVVARGRVVSATSQFVRIAEDNGTERELVLANLSAADQKAAWQVMDVPFECEFLGTQAYCRSFAPTHVAWHASNLCHKPLYFEDIQLERYGHTVGPIKQPFKSAGKFLVQAALLPYQMALYPPNECQYPLGLFRPGNCAPYLRTPFPWERRAIGYQAGVTTGLFLLVP